MSFIEPILQENKNRFVIFPIQHHDLWDWYKKQEASIWTAEEIDYQADVDDFEKLTKDEIKKLVIEDKWLTSIHNSINEEMENVSHKLASRIKELVDRYENPLPKLAKENQSLTEKIDKHLEKMGFN